MKKLIFKLLPLCLIVLLIVTCRKDRYDQPTGPTVKTTITGQLLDEADKPVIGVNVNAYGETTTTDEVGVFIFKNINVDQERCIVQFTKAGYYNRTHAFIPVGNSVSYLKIVLLSKPTPQYFSSSAGGTISLTDGSKVQLQPGSFIKPDQTSYIGMVTVYVKHLATDAAFFPYSIPGGDLLGKDTADNSSVLYSYGMMDVELVGSSGEQLQLAPGSPATITLPIASSQQASANSTIPLWYFDEKDNLWKEQGQATKVGNSYVGTVTHFTWWNYDVKGDRARVSGRVVDCNGNPVPNIVVRINGIYTTQTRSDGKFSIWIPSGISFTFQVLASDNKFGASSQVENISPLLNGESATVPDLVIGCPTLIRGTLKTCSGASINGIVRFYKSNLFYNYLYTEDGQFVAPVSDSASIKVLAISSIFSCTKDFISPAKSGVLNLGTLNLCDHGGSSYSNSFVANGPGYNNKLMIMNATKQSAQPGYGPKSFAISIQGNCDISYVPGHPYVVPVELQINFNDSIAGDYSFTPTSTNDFTLMLNNVAWRSKDKGSSATCKLTKVGAIGERVQGSFWGTFVQADSSATSAQPVSITNGNFEVIRIR